jgi:hypothetical protein
MLVQIPQIATAWSAAADLIQEGCQKYTREQPDNETASNDQGSRHNVLCGLDGGRRNDPGICPVEHSFFANFLRPALQRFVNDALSGDIVLKILQLLNGGCPEAETCRAAIIWRLSSPSTAFVR